MNTGGPVLKSCSWLGGGGEKRVCRCPQGGVERAVGWRVEGCCRASLSAAGRHSVATLSHRLAGPPEMEKKRKKKDHKRTWQSSLLDRVKRRTFPDTKAIDFKVCNITVIFTGMMSAAAWAGGGGVLPAAHVHQPSLFFCTSLQFATNATSSLVPLS